MISSREKSLHGSGINKLTQQFFDMHGVGILSPARYEIMIAAPSPGKNGDSPLWKAHARPANTNIDAMKRLSASCEATSIASRTISSNPNRIHGPVREMPYESVYGGDLDLTFRVGKDMFERKYFELWMDNIVDHSNNNISYYDDYTRDIYVAQLAPDDSIVYKVVYRECYPKTVNAIDLGFEKTDDYVRQTVSMAYREFEVINTAVVGGNFMFKSHEEWYSENDRRKAEDRAEAHRQLVSDTLGKIDTKLKTPVRRGEFRMNPGGNNAPRNPRVPSIEDLRNWKPT